MVSSEKTAKLKSFLGELPELIALRLAKAVEVDRFSDGQLLPHDVILDSLRPALRRLPGSERTPSALRAFCIPFEDLLTDEPLRRAKRKGRMARTAVAPIWNWVGETLLPFESKDYCRNFKTAIAIGNHAAARAYAQTFWPLVGHAIHHALASDTGRIAARAVLGSDLVVADAAEAALLLGIGDAVGRIHQTLVRPVSALSDEMAASLVAIHDAVLATTPDAAPYVAVIAMNQLLHPWEVLKLAPLISHQTQDKSANPAEVGLVGEIILDDIENSAQAVRGAKHPLFDDGALVENLSRFTALSGGIVKSIDARRAGKWGQGLIKDRAAIGDSMAGFMERAPRELLAALAYRKSGGFSIGAKTADFSHHVDAEKIESALRYARLVMGCKPFAAAASFGAALKKAEENMCQSLRRYSEDVIKELRTPDEERGAIVKAQFDTVVKLTDILLGEAEGDFLRRRGRAALRAF